MTAPAFSDVGKGDGSAKLVLWEGMTANGSGDPVSFPEHYEAYVQIVGTWDTATMVLEGSLDGTNYTTLDDIEASAISLTSGSAVLKLRDVPLKIRPTLSSVDESTDLDVYLLMVRPSSLRN